MISKYKTIHNVHLDCSGGGVGGGGGWGVGGGWVGGGGGGGVFQ